MAGVSRASQDKRARRRKHSFGGCRTCRRRHVKCDQVRPACLACRAVNVVCEGYSSEVRWMPPATLSSEGDGLPEPDDGNKDNTTRHHLYTEATRKSMSKALVAKLGSSSIDESLAEIDLKAKDAQGFGDDNLAIGPFGVLNFGAPAFQTGQQIVQDGYDHMRIDVSSMMDVAVPVQDVPSNHLEISDQNKSVPSMVDWFDPVLGFDNTLHWADLFALDFDNGTSSMRNQAEDPLDFFSFDNAIHTTDLSSASGPHALQTHQLGSPPPSDAEPVNECQGLTFHPPIDNNTTKLEELKSVEEAQFLLSHFNASVISQMASMPQTSKSPWRALQLPDAMHTLSDLSYLHSGSINHANAANLYAILACSAYHLKANPSIPSTETNTYWDNLFFRLKEIAKQHLQLSLREELRGNSRAKYKEQLMAILSMVALTNLTARFREARHYMLDAERLLRVRGLAKREISRRCRILHHIYSWLRIVGESTFVLHDYSSYGPIVNNMSAAYRATGMHDIPEAQNARSGNNARLDDFLRLQPHSSDSDLDIDDTKEHIVSLHDIHLEDSRQYGGTMYHVYGISETWLSLVSQTTRLANIIDAVNYNQENDRTFLDFLHKRATRLEHIVCSFALKDPPNEEEEDSIGSNAEQHPNGHMLRALNSALVILFYRRVRNVNPLILQGHVDSVAQSLKDFDAAIASQSMMGPGTPWPAFIAGCEALSRRNRKFLMNWIDRGYEKCGFEIYNVARQIMKTVWDGQNEPVTGDPGSGGSIRSQTSTTTHKTWVDVSREKNIWVTLC